MAKEIIAEISADGWVTIKEGVTKTHDIEVTVYRDERGARVAGVMATPLAPDSTGGCITVVAERFTVHRS